MCLLVSCSYRTYEEWKPSFVIDILEKVFSSYRTYEEWKLVILQQIPVVKLEVLTVPMRNGNGSYGSFSVDSNGGSYRTYEEWKRSITNIMDGIQYCSYRTYEEWKLFLPDEKSKHKHPVLTVPMRNGNT